MGYLRSLRDSAASILAKITETFQEYTIHDIRHKDKVCEILGWLVQPPILNQLTKYEIFFLVAATYLHDVGMADIPEIFDESEFSGWVVKQGKNHYDADDKREFIREFHHLRSEKYILRHYSDFHITNQAEAYIVSRIARGHKNLDELTDFKVYPRKFMYQNQSIDIAALAYFLQIADELDLTFERTPLLIYQSFNPKNPISKLEWEKALSISGVGPDPNDNRTIIMSALCRSEKVHRALALLEGKIQQKLDTADQVLDVFQSNIFPNRIKLQVSSSGYEYFDLKFSFSMKPMLPLLTRHIYSRPEDSIRELLQNAIDACHRRSDIYRKNSRGYCPRITVKVLSEKEGNILEVEDNGMGMDQHILTSYFGKVGRSFYTSPEFLKESPTFLPLSEFGIGILSAFMISDKVLIQTKSDNSHPYDIEIFPWDEHVFVAKGSRSSTGTTVRLWLKQGFSIDLPKVVAFYARHVDIPIEVEVDTRRIVINPRWCTYRDILEDQGYQIKYDAKPLTFKLETHEYQALVSFPSEEHPILGEIPGDVTSIAPSSANNLIAISRRGIFVTYLNIYEVSHKWGFIAAVDLDIRSAPIGLVLGRNDIQCDSRFANLIEDLIEKVLQRLKPIFDQYLHKDKITYAIDCLKITSSIFNFVAYENISRKIVDFITDFVVLPVFTNRQITVQSISQLKREKYLLVESAPPLRTTELKELFTLLRLKNSQDKMVFVEYRFNLETLLGERLKTVPFSSLFSIEPIYPSITIGVGLPGDFPVDIERFVIDFVRFTNCETKRFLLAVASPDVVHARTFRRETRIVQRLSINMNNEFAKAAERVFKKDFVRVMERICTELVTNGYDAVVKEQRVILSRMKNLGVADINRLIFTKEDFPSFLLEKRIGYYSSLQH